MEYKLNLENAFDFNQAEVEAIKQQWQALINMVVWGDIQSNQIGKLPRLRKRVLEVGESFRSFIAPKDWIEQPRQQLKSALGSSIKLRDSLATMLTQAAAISGGKDFDAFKLQVAALDSSIQAIIGQYENEWANLLDSLGYED